MQHKIHAVTRVEVVGPWTLRLTFDDGAVRVIDFQRILAGELYGPLREPAVFRQVRLDPEAHTIVWPNGADFDPATLHDWPRYEDAWARQSRKWARVAESPATYEKKRAGGATARR